MILETTIAEINQQVILLDEHFINNKKRWEVVNDNEESAYFDEGYYYMHNKTNDQWMFYSIESGLHSKDDFIITATLECVTAPEGGNHGLLWGFNKQPACLNRFVLSASKPRYSIIHFERENSYSFMRNYGVYDAIQGGESSINEISIVKIGQQLYFFINDPERPVFQYNQNAYPCFGTRVGFYTEPGQIIRAHRIQVRKLITKAASKSNWKDVLYGF